MATDMTISEVLRDPLIRQVLRADGIAPDVFSAALKQAAAGLRRSPRLARSSTEAQNVSISR
ncbi:hypothetical protein ASD03_11455 [Ensifer sp. Root127]|nr:hypothetical protein ASD03_11455 [Ensifer sp. Root127]